MPHGFRYFIKSLIDAGHTAVCGSAQGSSFVNQRGKTIPFPLVSFFSEVALRGFTVQEARHFLKKSSMLSGDELTTDEITYIITLIGLVPHNLQNIGFNIFSVPEFIGLKGDDRLKIITQCIKEYAWMRQSHFLQRITSDPLFSVKLLDKIVEIAQGKKTIDDPELNLLKKRGFISEGTVPFEYQGSLFREFLRSIPLSVNKGTPIRDRLAKAGGVALDTAIKAAVGIAFG